MKRILCIGDSNTYGYDPRSYLGSRYPADIRWAGQLGAYGFSVINEGENGRAFPREDELPALKSRIRANQPLDTVIVLLGTNDMLLGRTAAETGRRALDALEAVCAETEKNRVLLIAPPALVRGEWVREESVLRESRLLSCALWEAAEICGVRFADANEWGIRLAFDGVHFAPEGHRTFLKRLIGALEQIGLKADETASLQRIP